MSTPFFYIFTFDPAQKEIQLEEDTSKHIVQVLRMKVGETIQLTDGRGHLLTTTIIDDHKKHCSVRIEERSFQPAPVRKISIGISLIKNTSRFEWFLEKATEIGISEIVPLICQRTDKEKFRTERLQGILISAMLQSQQTWLPILHAPIAYELLFRQEEVAAASQKFIAHCVETDKQELSGQLLQSAASQLILIGPEGDFSEDEIQLATSHHFIPVTLGATRLRTETAGMYAAVILKAAG